MSDTPQGPGWWMASDGRFYAPELHPDAARLADPAAQAGAARAGVSAQSKAEELRARAAELESQADNWERGAEGERMTAAALASLPDSWVVVHDLHVPGSRANVDHVVVGPNGVWVVDSKAYSGTYRLGDGTLWRGRYPIRRETETLNFIAGSVGSFLEVPVWACFCFTHAELPDPVVDLPTVRVCRVEWLPSVLTSGPARYTPDQVEMIGARARTLVVPRAAAAAPAAPIPTGAPDPVPAPTRSGPPRKSRPSTVSKSPRTPPKPSAKKPSTKSGSSSGSKSRSRRRKKPSPGEVAVQIAVGLVVLFVVMKAVTGMAAKSATTTTVPPTVVTTACPTQPC